MFLWVQLVMSALDTLYFEDDLQETIDSLPTELEPL